MSEILSFGLHSDKCWIIYIYYVKVQTCKHFSHPYICTNIYTADEELIVKFYEDIQEMIDEILNSDVMYLMRDWNAKVGSEEERINENVAMAAEISELIG